MPQALLPKKAQSCSILRDSYKRAFPSVRPRVMQALAKLGFTQSYTYFTWRHFKQEFIDYLTELTQSPVKEYMRPNFFPSTPDINPPFLQTGGRPGHQIRLVLAATLSSA